VDNKTDKLAGAALFFGDPDLARVRESGALDRLSAAERDEWRALWKEVGALRKRATSP
jgi:hypothetical protein